MQYEDDLRVGLRHRLRAAVRDHDRIAIAALREAIAALDNAEALPIDTDLNAQAGPYVAGGAVGLGAAEAERRTLDVAAQQAIVTTIIDARLAAANTYEEHGQTARAADLRSGAETLIAILEERFD
jgi:uncharacterized protein